MEASQTVISTPNPTYSGPMIPLKPQPKRQPTDLENFVIYGGLTVFPLSILVTYLMLNATTCLIDQCTFDIYPQGNQTMQIALGVYHVWLWSVGGVLYLAKHNPKLKQFLTTPVFFRMNCGQFCLGVALASLLIFNTTFWYYTFQAAWQTSDVYVPYQNLTAYRQPYEVSQQTGRFNEILLGLSLLPVARYSVLDKIFDLSYLNAIAFHRVVGAWLILSVALHGSAFTYAATLKPLNQSFASFEFNEYDPPMSESMAASNLSWSKWGNGMYMNEMGVLGGICMVLPAIFSFPYMRRHFFNFFTLFHTLLLCTLGFAMLHATSNFYYSLPGIGLYAIEIFTTLYVRFNPVPVQSTQAEPCNLLRLDIDISSRRELQDFKPQQFCRLCFPSIMPWEWHPFTMIGKQGSTALTVLVSSNTDNPKAKDWCKHVAKTLLDPAIKMDSVYVSIAGPFGGHQYTLLNAQHADCTTLFLTGGAGITPALGVLLNEPQGTLVLEWSVRAHGSNPAELSLLAELPAQVRVQIHVTDGTDTVKDAENGRAHVTHGRVDFVQVLRQSITKPGDQVFVSGPKSFNDAALEAIVEFERQVNFKVATFVGSFEL